MKWKPRRSAAENAQRRLPRLARKYFKAGRKAIRGSRSPEDLHSFRVRTKRFRYTLEIFQPLYGEELEGLLGGLHHVQNLLGDISDASATSELLRGKDDFEKALRQQIRKKIRSFRKYWKRSFDAPRQLALWQSALAAPAAWDGAAPR